MTKIILNLITYLVFANHSFSQGNWIKRNDIPGEARSGATAFTILDKAYIIAGEDTTLSQDLFEYDPSNDSWVKKANFPGAARKGGVAFSIGDKGYFGTGLSGKGPNYVYHNDFYEYDPSLNKWTQKKDFAGAVRWNAVAFTANNLGYIGTGDSDVDTYQDFFAYDPNTDLWNKVADLPDGKRTNASGFGINGKGYIAAGTYIDSETFTTYLRNNLYEYDPQTDSWGKKTFAEGFLARQNAASFDINGKGYLVGGLGSNGTWEYDPKENEWTKMMPFGAVSEDNRYSAVGFSVESRGFVGTGIYSKSFTDAEKKKDIWEFTPDIINNINNDQRKDTVLFSEVGNGLYLIKGLTAKTHVHICNMSGIVVLNDEFDKENHKLDISDKPSGLYFITIISGKNVKKTKFIKF